MLGCSEGSLSSTVVEFDFHRCLNDRGHSSLVFDRLVQRHPSTVSSISMPVGIIGFDPFSLGLNYWSSLASSEDLPSFEVYLVRCFDR